MHERILEVEDEIQRVQFKLENNLDDIIVCTVFSFILSNCLIGYFFNKNAADYASKSEKSIMECP